MVRLLLVGAWTIFLMTMLTDQCNGHGYLKEPPSRSSMWRYGFHTPKNYDDNQLFCGGFDVQWNKNGGKCGICGDRWDGPRDNEAGGKYATGTISRNYKEGQAVHVEVKLTMQHGGYFEFRICPNNDPSRTATQECLNRYLLRQPDGSTRYYPKGGSKTYNVQLMLPRGLTCTQCVFQWIWNTASNWGCEGGQCGRGFGHQEQFRGCSDVAISPSGTSSQNSNSIYASNLIHTASENNNQQSGTNIQGGNTFIPLSNNIALSNHQNTLTNTVGSQESGYGSSTETCRATDKYKAQFPYADQFCINQCRAGRCLSEYFCTSPCRNLNQLNTKNAICEATPQFKTTFPYATQYCITLCKSGTCPVLYCNDACRQHA